MKIPESTKPVIWGMVCGGIVTMIVGFSLGGWITAGAAGQLKTASAKAAVIQAFSPICVEMAESQLSKLSELKELSSWKQKRFVDEAGWVDNVSEKYRSDVAGDCATTLVEAMKIS